MLQNKRPEAFSPDVIQIKKSCNFSENAGYFDAA